MAMAQSMKAAEEDDDIVFMDEETAQQSLAAKIPSIDVIRSALADTTENARMTEEEIKMIKKELEQSEENLSRELVRELESRLSNPECPIRCEDLTERQLDTMISQVLESIPPSEFDLSDAEFNILNHRLDSIELATQSISKQFLDCHVKLKEVKLKQAKELEVLKEALNDISEETLNVPDIDEMVNQEVRVICPSVTATRPPSESVSKLPGSSVGPPAPMPSMDVLRSQLSHAISQSIPATSPRPQQKTPPTSKQQQTRQSVPRTSQVAPRPPQVAFTQTASGPPPIAPRLVQSTSQAHIQWPDLRVHDKVLGKKFNNVWYGGTIMDIAPPNQHDPEWRCRVKFDGKGMKWLPPIHVAYRDPINCFIRVGTRVVALYREDDAQNSFYAGVIAEAPSLKNSGRFLVFFDDGYAQYCEAREIYKVYRQSANVWEDVNPETSGFIKEYLRIYPERPMVRLSKGQVVRTEWNGQWWTSKVVETDASLVKMYFQADKRTEWIYRGSTRLEPLFKALANADAIKAQGSAKGRRYNQYARPSTQGPKPSVEYTRGNTEDESSTPASISGQSAKAKHPTPRQSTEQAPALEKKKMNVARKSTTPSSNSSSSEVQTQTGAERGKSMASILHERLANPNAVFAESNPVSVLDGSVTTGKRREIKFEQKPRTAFKPHACSKECLQVASDNPLALRGQSMHTIPLRFGWERLVCKVRPSARRMVMYRAPCGRRLRSLDETDRYLQCTDSQLTIDMFSFDQHLHVNTEFVPVNTFCDIKDLSYGRENYPVSCVNGVDRHYPDYVEYSGHRMPSKKVKLNTDEDFLVCCDCTDNCRDRSKCACQQLTIENTTWIGERNESAGYHHKRLKEPIFTGVMECNSRCKCDRRCSNRVVQHGLTMRLQVFKTEKKGWGLRCLDDIAKGSFICIYAGQLLTDREANEDGKQYGDQYLAELDFIEVVERQKEGYESDVEGMDFSDDEKDANYKATKDSEDDSSYKPPSDFDVNCSQPQDSERSLRKRKNREKKKNEEEETEREVEKEKEAEKKATDNDEDYDDTANTLAVKPDSVTGRMPRAKKSTGGSRMNPSSTMKASQELDKAEKDHKEGKKEYIPTRSFFRDDTECYIMDAKSSGNLGRYLNHSCNPNVFVQNIFVDTHDLRFPWVTFWAGQYIRAGTELTWDYNYEVGSVPDRVLYCYCNSNTCRGRLL